MWQYSDRGLDAVWWQGDHDTNRDGGKQDEAWCVWNAADPAQPSQQDLQGAQEAGVAGPRLSPSLSNIRAADGHGWRADGGGVVQATVKKKRRYKPGTVALREIRKCEAKLTHRSGHTRCLASFTV